MGVSPSCDGSGSASCVMLNCIDELLLLGACYISLTIFLAHNARLGQLHFSVFGFEFTSRSYEQLQDPRAQNNYTAHIAPWSMFLEFIGLIGELTISITLLFHGQSCPLAFASVVFSIYLLSILGCRIYAPELGIETHSIALYCLRWLFTAYSAFTMIFGAPGSFNLVIVTTRLAIFSILCLLHGISRRAPNSMSYEDFPQPGKDESASILSQLTFSWMDQVVWRAFKRPLEVYDLYPLGRAHIASLLATKWSSTSPNTAFLPLRMLKFAKYDFLIQGGWAFFGSLAVFFRPFIVQKLLQYLQNEDRGNRNVAWLYVFGLLVSGFVGILAECQASWIWRKIGAKIRSVLLTEIYAKTLRRSLAKPLQDQSRDDTDGEEEAKAAEDKQNSNGNMLNLISVDVEVIANTSGTLYLIWVNFPVQISIGTYLLYDILGPAGIAGLICAVCLLPVNLLISRKLMKVQRSVLEKTDARIHMSNEVLNNIRAIKYSAWEMPFIDMVQNRRHQELKGLRSRFIWWSISMILFLLLPALMTSLCLFFYTVIWGNDLGSDIAFPALAVFAVLRMPINRLADTVNYYLQAYVSLQRVAEFLAERDTKKYKQLVDSDPSFVGMDNATLRWPVHKSTENTKDGVIEMSSRPSFELNNISVSFKLGALNVVCGPSGSGKSSLLLALIGEMELVAGRISCPHEEPSDKFSGVFNFTLSQTTAYCPQEPWIMNRTIRDNILLGMPFDASRYETVLHAVALLPDLASLDQGDRTIAGENGSKLSGGQKQRTALARALYSCSKYVLLDDCLSAVDSRTAQHIFFHAITGSLMRGRTCILATHHTHLAIPHSSHVVMLDNGQVKAQGTNKELISTGILDAEIMETTKNSDEAWDDLLIEPWKLDPSLVTSSKSAAGKEKEELVLKDYKSEKTISMTEDGQSELLEPLSGYSESKAEGSVAWSTIKFWLGSMGTWWYWIIVLLVFGVQQMTGLGLTLWLKTWASQYDRLKSDQGAGEHEQIGTSSRSNQISDGYYLTIYAVLIATYVVVMFSRDMSVFFGSLKASRFIYGNLLNSILHAKFSFFDRVPLGQITNRFSRDIQTLDQSIVTLSINGFTIAGFLVTVVLLISVYIPAFLVVAVVITGAYYGISTIYLHGARDLRRIESVERSPLYQQFSETVAGNVDIRAYARTSTFVKEFNHLIDRINSPYLLQWASQEWLTFRIGLFSSLTQFFAGAFILWKQGSILPSAAGLILTYATSFTDNMLWLVQIYAYIQQDLNSIERIEEFIQVEQEPSKPIKDSAMKVPGNWPTRGHIRFSNYTARYAPTLKPALEDVSFEAAAGKRTAIVGRTGAGKSTLAMALIRGLEAESGQIAIDDVDVGAINLRQLRKAVAVVPQDPKLFEGSLRHNLAPLGLHDDEKMLEVLRAFQVLGLGSDPESITINDLDHPAETLSRGQRQMLCIARGILRRCRVIVLDEATASIDHDADAAVQMGLRASIVADTTVLTIAHRLISIADYDHVIVLDAGHVVEQGSPRELLARQGEDARFRIMCENSGDLDEIRRLAGVLQDEE